ncbi:conserved protein of unknown function [Xenorhabdus poinarii G6]|uniref:Lipoprotein n=1 Tax=Xenorhabdus poinarii G6 TaxID=1354304 RepID=A0A068QZU5_9GAMM|nr:conserved protein of unknown function [Xenorhabdus poinarii G6]
MRRLLVICLLGCVLAGCDNQPKIDGTNEIALKTSIEKIRETLPEDKKLQFDDSLNVVMTNSINFDDLFKDNREGNIKYGDIQKFEQRFYQSLHGKTADQVIEEAEKIKAANMRKK